jgi:hypothetical protein
MKTMRGGETRESLWVREFREIRDSEDFREQTLAESELALTNLQRFDPVLKSGGWNSELGRRP